MANKYTYAIWKRKTASAQVRLFDGKGENTVNGKKLSEYFSREDLFDTIYSPVKLAKLKDKVHFDIKVIGSGISAQAQAIRHGLTRALVSKDEALRTILKAAGFITRDSRKVERKKPGRHKARKGMQWSKR